MNFDNIREWTFRGGRKFRIPVNFRFNFMKRFDIDVFPSLYAVDGE